MGTLSSLPPNWTHVLEDIQRALLKAIDGAEAREAALARHTSAVAETVPDVTPGQPLTRGPSSGHGDALEERIGRMEMPLLSFDETLKSEEEDVRLHLTKVADLRQRLADWAASAIK